VKQSISRPSIKSREIYTTWKARRCPQSGKEKVVKYCIDYIFYTRNISKLESSLEQEPRSRPGKVGMTDSTTNSNSDREAGGGGRVHPFIGGAFAILGRLNRTLRRGNLPPWGNIGGRIRAGKIPDRSSYEQRRNNADSADQEPGHGQLQNPRLDFKSASPSRRRLVGLKVSAL